MPLSHSCGTASADNKGVTDQLFLSIWLERGSRAARLKHFTTMLRLFPFSQRDQPETLVSVMAISTAEPPLLERTLKGPVEAGDLLEILEEFQGDDLAYEIETWWDLWELEEDAALAPTRVALSCFGPEFDNGSESQLSDQEDLRIDFGIDAHYLPQPHIPGSPRLIESNIRSLLRLVHELDAQLPVAKRILETESGENFAERLQRVLTGSDSVQ